MDRTRPGLTTLCDEAQGAAVAAACLYGAVFLLWEMASAGAAAPLVVAATCACACAAALLGHAAARRSACRYRKRSLRVYFPACAGLLCAQAAILPAYLATVPPAAY